MMNTQFKSAWWLPNAHMQTIWPALCRRPVKGLNLQRERIELPDGDFVDLDWTQANETNHAATVLILHGLEGNIESHYAKGMLRAITQQGWRGVFMHFRGCSGEHNRLPRSYHSGDTADVATVINMLHQRDTKIRLAAIGFSLGGNVLLKWLGETGQNNPLTAAAAISVPFELQKTIRRVQQGFSRLYQWHLLKSLRTRLGEKFSVQIAPIDLPPFENLQTIEEFDNQFTAPLHGFANADEYYRESSSRQYLRNITVPTLLINAKDDPFMTEDILPRSEELSEQVQLEVTSAGGHVGFVSGKFPWQPHYWLEERVPDFLHSYLD